MLLKILNEKVSSKGLEITKPDIIVTCLEESAKTCGDYETFAGE